MKMNFLFGWLFFMAATLTAMEDQNRKCDNVDFSSLSLTTLNELIEKSDKAELDQIYKDLELRKRDEAPLEERLSIFELQEFVLKRKGQLFESQLKQIELSYQKSPEGAVSDSTKHAASVVNVTLDLPTLFKTALRLKIFSPEPGTLDLSNQGIKDLKGFLAARINETRNAQPPVFRPSKKVFVPVPVLKKLNLQGNHISSSKLYELPGTLEELNVTGNDTSICLPSDLSHLKKLSTLKGLQLDNTFDFGQNLPESLQELELTILELIPDGKGVIRRPPLEHLTRLTRLKLNRKHNKRVSSEILPKSLAQLEVTYMVPYGKSWPANKECVNHDQILSTVDEIFYKWSAKDLPNLAKTKIVYAPLPQEEITVSNKSLSKFPMLPLSLKRLTFIYDGNNKEQAHPKNFKELTNLTSLKVRSSAVDNFELALPDSIEELEFHYTVNRFRNIPEDELYSTRPALLDSKYKLWATNLPNLKKVAELYYHDGDECTIS
ncbi:MAG TPA: hypothetical protein VHO47_02610 [Candidatus Babeliales bacterium]|nr:hypothetical protein [Candidatus Babeliales bacterium]